MKPSSPQIHNGAHPRTGGLYGPSEASGVLYRGQERSTLINLFGHPDMVDITQTAKNRREVLKFFPSGSNRYKLKVTVENGLVIGWEIKG